MGRTLWKSWECEHCGHVNDQVQKFCGNCGQEMPAEPSLIESDYQQEADYKGAAGRGEYRVKLLKLKSEKERNNQIRSRSIANGTVIVILICIVWLFVAIVDGNSGGAVWAILCALLAFLTGCVWGIVTPRALKEQEAEIQKYTDLAEKERAENKIQCNVPKDAPVTVFTYRDSELSQDCACQTYVFDNKLCFYAVNLNKYVEYFDIDIDAIQFFRQEGEVYRETKISGGGGGGSSIAGAVVGGVIAGPAGAVIGSRRKTQEIKSELITHDERITLLITQENEYKFRYKDYDVFMQLIPQKAEKNVAMEYMQSDKRSAAEKIKEIAALRDAGIINEEEFQEKKTELLSRI